MWCMARAVGRETPSGKNRRARSTLRRKGIVVDVIAIGMILEVEVDKTTGGSRDTAENPWAMA
jgi:hypothetical protein